MTSVGTGASNLSTFRPWSAMRAPKCDEALAFHKRAAAANRPRPSQVCLRERHRLACSDRFIDRHHDLYVAQPFFARHTSRLAVLNALREVVHLGGKLVAFRKPHFLAIPAPPLVST